MPTVDPQTILNESRAFALTLKAELDDAVSNLESFATDRMTWVDFPARPVFEPEKPARIPADQLPTLERAVFGNEFGDPTSDLEKYKGHVFLSPMLDSMQGILMQWVESGGVGISNAVQDALFNNMRERDLQAQRDALDMVKATDAKRGFAYPTHRRRTTEVIVNYQQTVENRNREITAIMADLAQKNVQAAISSNIAIEQLQSGFSLGFAEVWGNIKKLIIDKYRIETDVRIGEFKAKMEAIIAGYNLAEANGRLDISYQELLANKWQIEMQQGTSRTQSLIAQADNQTQMRLAAAQSYVAGLSAAISAALMQTSGIAVSNPRNG